MYLSEIPGYTRAVGRGDRLEDYYRNFAFLGLKETLRFPGGFSIEVKQLTLRMFVQFCAVHSPFFVGGRIGPEHVAQILWRISPDYDTRSQNVNARQQFVERIAKIPYKAAIRTVNRYLDRQLMDKPPVPLRRNDAKPDTSFAASIIHTISSRYGWSDELILDLPMPRLLQYLRRIRRDMDSDMARFSPIRDRLTSRITTKFLASRKREKPNGTNGDEG